MEPLRHDSPFLQPARPEFIILTAEHAPHSGHPWVGGLGDNDIVLFRAELQHGARVLAPNPRDRVGQYPSIPFCKVTGGTDHWLAVLGDREVLDGVAENGSACDAATQAKNENVLRIRTCGHRNMSHHELGA